MRRALPLVLAGVAATWWWQRARSPALRERTAKRLRAHDPRPTPSAEDIHVA
jgi:hypothetical protein